VIFLGSQGVIEEHRQAGRLVSVGGLDTFVRESGQGEPVVCIHGVPTSSFLYRKVLDGLREEGLRGFAFDLPGLGLSDRPEDFDYTWTGLGNFTRNLVETLELDSFHLVVHDIGGPIGFELAHHKTEAIQSLTILNTMIRAHEFRRPWPMKPFAYPGLGELWLSGMIKPVFRQLMYRFGVENNDCMGTDELNAYVDLLKRDDRGEAFLKIMRGFELTSDKQDRYVDTVRDLDVPKAVVWGATDPALPLDPFAHNAREIAGVDRIVELEARHFLQEEQPRAIAREVRKLSG
jgi:pimeloyl-ACP methyl ester carboxylesterase